MFIWQYITVRGQPRTGKIIFDDLLAVWPNGIVGCHSRFACLSLPSLDVGVDLKRVIRSLSFLVLSIHRLSLLVVSPGGSRPSPSFPAPSSGLWPLGVGYPRLPCTAFDTFGFSLCMGSNEAWFGPGIFLVSLECYCADVVSILSPPPWQPNVYMAIYHGQRPAPDRQNHF